MTNDQKRRRGTFDQVAELYDRVRPCYPQVLFDDIEAISRMPPASKILEIGCGTGQATLPLARRGYHIHCVELGERLAQTARQKLEPYPNAEVWNSAFESWSCTEESYDLVLSANAFHWLDPAIRYQKAAKALKPSGAIALCWNVHVQTALSADFFEAVQTVYERIVPGIAEHFRGLPHPDAVSTPVKDEIAQTALFEEVMVRRYLWKTSYTAARYMDLLNTFSDHRSLGEVTRAQLLRGIAELIETHYGGCITKEYLTILYLAHRR